MIDPKTMHHDSASAKASASHPPQASDCNDTGKPQAGSLGCGSVDRRVQQCLGETPAFPPGPASAANRKQRGFTLLEILLAVAITSVVMMTVGSAFIGILQAREEVSALAESARSGPEILSMIERDLRGLWHHNIKNNAILVGRNRDVAGFPADRLDFLTTSDAVGIVVNAAAEAKRPSLCEVGYWLKENDRYPDLRELWRREDPMVDEDVTAGGTFQLVHDRIKTFEITYFETLGNKAEELRDWESSKSSTLPRRIKIELTVERKLPNRNRVSGAEVTDFEDTVAKYTRYIVFDPRYPQILTPGVAMLPLAPPAPLLDTEGGGPAGGGGPLGGGGPGEVTLGRNNVSVTTAGPGGRQMPGGQRPPSPPAGGSGSLDLGGLLKGGGNRGGGLFIGNGAQGGGGR